MAGDGYFLIKDCEELQIQIAQEPLRSQYSPSSKFERTTLFLWLYFIFLAWRLLSFILYIVHSSDCNVKAKHQSFHCPNSTLIPHSLELELSWQIGWVINCSVCVAVLPKVPAFEGYWATFKRLAKFSRFWSLLGQLLLIVVYTVLVPSLESSPVNDVSVALQVGFVLGPILSTLVVCLWNFVPCPARHSCLAHPEIPYHLTLLLLFLENLYLFVLVTIQIAFGITGMRHSDFKYLHPSLHAVFVVVHAGEASFYYTMSKFFWNKLFDDRKNLLKADHIWLGANGDFFCMAPLFVETN